MLAIFARQHGPIGSDQDVGRQAEASALRGNGRQRLATPQDAQERAQDAKQNRRPCSRIDQRTGARLHTELRVQAFVGVGDQRKRQAAGVKPQVRLVRMEQHDFADAGLLDLRMPEREGAQMKVANRAPGEAAKLQVRQPVGSGKLDLSRNRRQLQRAHSRADRDTSPSSAYAFNHQGTPFYSLLNESTITNEHPIFRRINHRGCSVVNGPRVKIPELEEPMPDNIDRRVARTQRAMRAALVGLLRRKAYADITVQDILDEADIGRSTFYSHCSGKDQLVRLSFRLLRAELAAAASEERDDAPACLLPFALPVIRHLADGSPFAIYY